jgi:hypothetical protein
VRTSTCKEEFFNRQDDFRNNVHQYLTKSFDAKDLDTAAAEESGTAAAAAAAAAVAEEAETLEVSRKG